MVPPQFSLTVLIHPPWWRTGWAGGAYATGLLVLPGLARREIIRRERLQASLEIERVAAEKLRELDALKSQFFANISHEFRTPLAVITGTVEKLGREDAPLAERRRDYQLIDRYAGRLLQLINQLLDLSRLDARKLVLQPQPGDLAMFLGFVTGSFASLFAHQRIAYRCRLPGPPLWVQYDADGLRKILTNLLSNALKFTPEGGSVEVTVEADQRDQARTALQIIVPDTGIGIPADQLPRIFDRFYQADASFTRACEGTGIGLALVRELVALFYPKNHSRMDFFIPLASGSWLARSGCLRTPLLLLLACLTAAGPARAQEMPPRQQWDKTLGGSAYDELHAVLVTPDGGYLLAGTSVSPASGDKRENGPGGGDYWVVKLDRNGTKQWDKTFGGLGSDMLTGLAPAADGGYLLAGTSASPAGVDKREDSRGGNDYWVVKIDSGGAKVWDKTFGGTNADDLIDLVATPDGGYLLGGTSTSGKGGEKS